jgi:hypothetical protein
MFRYTKETPTIYKFKTNKGSNYKVGFRYDSLLSVEIALIKEDNVNDEDSNAIFSIMDTVSSIFDDFLKENKTINKIYFSIIGENENNINQKNLLYNRYIERFKKNYQQHINISIIRQE